jgi:intermediate peptidase
VRFTSQHFPQPGGVHIRSRWCASIRNIVKSRYIWSASTVASTSERGTGLFDIPEFSDVAGFAFETKKCIQRSKELVEEIKSLSDHPNASIIDLMDQLSDELCRVADLAECMRQIHPLPEVSYAAQEACLAINSYVEKLNTDTGLYKSLRNLMYSEQFAKFDEVMRRTADVFMHDFEVSGIHLMESVQKSLVQKNDHLLEIGYAFSLNASQPTLLNSGECPANLKGYFHEEKGVAHVDYVPYVDHDPGVRENGYRLYYARDKHKMNVFEELLLSRMTIAQITGYPSFAHRQLKMSMAESPEVVVNFLRALSEKILPLAKEDVLKMKHIQANHSKLFTECSIVNPWDVPLIMSKTRDTFLPGGAVSMKNWFSLDSCLGGLDGLFRSLFGVSLKVMPVKKGEVWHPNVYKFGFVDDGGHLLGYTYGDLVHRDSKLASDCHFTIRGGREIGGDQGARYQVPVITLCCSIEPPSKNSPVLLSRNSVETLFHEMGHALHSMLGRAKYQNVTGTRCSTDFAEVPSTLMEFFLSDERVLTSFGKHYTTGDSLPMNLVRQFQLSGHFYAAYEMQAQICNAITDQHFHSATVSETRTTEWIWDTYRDIISSYSPLEYAPNTAYFLRFVHLGSYGARYYSYLWSRAVASLIWKSSFEQDPFSRASGEKLRAMLSFGGGINPQELVKGMLGFEPSVEELVNALYSDVLKHRQQVEEFNSLQDDVS